MTARFRLVAAVHLFPLRGDGVLLLRRRNTGREDGNWSVVAGHLDGGERVTAAIRGRDRDAGLLARLADRGGGVMHRNADSERVAFFCAAMRWAADVVLARCAAGECRPLRAAGVGELPARTLV